MYLLIYSRQWIALNLFSLMKKGQRLCILDQMLLPVPKSFYKSCTDRKAASLYGLKYSVKTPCSPLPSMHCVFICVALVLCTSVRTYRCLLQYLVLFLWHFMNHKQNKNLFRWKKVRKTCQNVCMICACMGNVLEVEWFMLIS